MSENKESKFNLEEINVSQNFIIEVGKNLKDLHSNILKYNEELDKGNFPVTLKLLVKITTKTNNLDKILKQNNEIKIIHLEDEVSKIKKWINDENSLREHKKSQYKDFFLHNLFNKFKSCELEVKGNFPIFKCNNFKFELDTRKMTSKLIYGGDKEKIDNFDDWNLESISNSIKNFYDFFKNINIDEELKIIYQSYINCRNKNLESAVDWIPILDILSEYLKTKQNPNNELKYPEKAFFSFLIYLILQDPSLVISGKKMGRRTATHTAAGNKNEHLWIPLNKEDLLGENIMYLSFKEII
jgi:hypothetical protein